MEILLWLVPAGVVTIVAMLWAAWAGRRQQRELDRDEAVRRLARVLEKPAKPISQPRRSVAPRERSTGVAVRRRPNPMASRQRRRAS